jgi:hypothetical protein
MTAKIIFYIEAGQGARGEHYIDMKGSAITKTEFLKKASDLWDKLF